MAHAKNVLKGLTSPKAFLDAWDGILHSLRTQPHFKIHFTAAALALLLGLALNISPFEWALIFIVIGNVFASEVLNTAIEHLVDLIEKNYDIDAKIAKDAAAGMVLVNAIVAVCAGSAIFVPKILSRIFF